MNAQSLEVSRARRRQRGVSLVEILIVIALIAVMSGVIISSTGMLSSTRLRSASTLVITGVRMGLSRANATGKPARLVFDLDGERLLLEQTEARMLRVASEDEGAQAGAEASTSEEREAQEYSKAVTEGVRKPRPRFSPVAEWGFDGDDPGAGRELGRSITFRSVQTEHDTEAREEGRAYLYFWPGGGTERAAIQLMRDGDDEDVLTVAVSALTGRSQVIRGAVELEDGRSDADFGEREE